LTLALKVMMSMIEPVMICVMAIGVGFLLVSILSALFSITSSISMQ
jgi:type II secretory pathway component PulF